MKAFATLAQKYPTSPLAAEANFHVGEDHYAKKQYAEAVKSYEQAAQANNLALSEKVHYKLGWAHYQLQQYQQSLDQFRPSCRRIADGKLASDAWFMKGECLFRLKDYQKALPALVEAMAREASSPQIAVLRQLHAGQAALQLEKMPESIAFLDASSRSFPRATIWRKPISNGAVPSRNSIRLEQAVADFKQAARAVARDAWGPAHSSCWAKSASSRNSLKRPSRISSASCSGTGRIRLSPEVKNWQAKAGYEAGRCCEVMIESAASPAERSVRIADAKKFYRYVVETHPDNELAAEAKKRLDVLAKL